MKIQATKHLKIKLKGDDIGFFKSALSKIQTQSKSIGFINQHNLSTDELKVLNTINEKIQSS